MDPKRNSRKIKYLSFFIIVLMFLLIYYLAPLIEF